MGTSQRYAVLAAAVLIAAGADVARAEQKAILTATNPDPRTLPTLAVRVDGGEVKVSATFPQVPECTCDARCYESSLDFIAARVLDGGRVQLRHRIREEPRTVLLTTVTPEPGAIEFIVRADPDASGGAPPPEEMPVLNLCWQLGRAKAFASAPDPYPEFVKRCFIFTEKGRTFLDKTIRRRLPNIPVDHLTNNPPWGQLYCGTWQKSLDPNYVGPDCFITSVIGVVSRDGKWLTALANDSANSMSQAWMDCVHCNPQWFPPANLPMSGPFHSPQKVDRTWRLKAYVMENDPRALLSRVDRDFPAARYQQSLGDHASVLYDQWIRRNPAASRDSLAGPATSLLSWPSGQYKDFNAWRDAARSHVMRGLPAPPVVPLHDDVVGRQDRGTYTASRLVLSLTGYGTVLGLGLIPKGSGPFPAVLLMHDDGGGLDMGKEKMIEPLEDAPERVEAARRWVQKYYGRRFIGDELAERGYVCLCVDSLNWSSLSRTARADRQASTSEVLRLETGLRALIAHEDVRAAALLASWPYVDPKRVASMGLSMGGFRAWQVAALSDRIAAGVAVGWMAAAERPMAPDSNPAPGQTPSATTLPGLAGGLDYPDLASLACPKPMLFYNGEQDESFPLPAVRDAYARLHRVWASQGADDRLATKLWNAPQVFNRKMQDEAFAWLDRQLGVNAGEHTP
jgi:dienelactone hydrolase